MRLPYDIGQTFSLPVLPKAAAPALQASDQDVPVPVSEAFEVQANHPSTLTTLETTFVLRPRVQTRAAPKIVVNEPTDTSAEKSNSLFVNQELPDKSSDIPPPTHDAAPPSNFGTTPEGRVHVFGNPPQTVCHTSVFLYNQTHHHILECGHEIYTSQPQPCGRNCKLDGLAKAPISDDFKCEFPKCVAAWKKRAKGEASAFAPRYGKPYVRPSRACFLSTAKGERSARADQDRNVESSMNRAASRQQKKKEPQRSVASQRPAARNRERERSPDRQELKGKEGSDYREREPLTRRSARIQSAIEHTVQFFKFDVAPQPTKTDLELDDEIPHSRLYKQGPDNADFSHPEHKVRAMQHEITLDSNDFDPEPEDEEPEEPDFGIDIQQKYCICHSDADGNPVECVDCGRSYHPFCINKALQDLSTYHNERIAHQSRALDAEQHRETEDFTCVGCDGKRAAAAEGKKRTFGWPEEQAEKARAGKLLRAYECSKVLDESVDVCDICNVQILGLGFRCRCCVENFDLCRQCMRDPGKTVQHQHPELEGDLGGVGR